MSLNQPDPKSVTPTSNGPFDRFRLLMPALLPSICGAFILFAIWFYGRATNFWARSDNQVGRGYAFAWAVSHLFLLLSWLGLNMVLLKIIQARWRNRVGFLSILTIIGGYIGIALWMCIWTSDHPTQPPVQMSPDFIDPLLFPLFKKENYYLLPYIMNVGGGMAVWTIIIVFLATASLLAWVFGKIGPARLPAALQAQSDLARLLRTSLVFTFWAIIEIAATYFWAISSPETTLKEQKMYMVLGYICIITIVFLLLNASLFLTSNLVLVDYARRITRRILKDKLIGTPLEKTWTITLWEEFMQLLPTLLKKFASKVLDFMAKRFG